MLSETAPVGPRPGALQRVSAKQTLMGDVPNGIGPVPIEKDATKAMMALAASFGMLLLIA